MSRFAVWCVKYTWPVPGLQNRGHLKTLNDNKLVLNEHELPSWSFRISFRVLGGSLFPKPVTVQVLFLDTWYSKTVLTFDCSCLKHLKRSCSGVYFIQMNQNILSILDSFWKFNFFNDSKLLRNPCTDRRRYTRGELAKGSFILLRR